MDGLKKAVFLDRDGVINRDPGDYTYNWNEFEFNEGVIPVLQEFQAAGFLLIIVTNQGGIAKGVYTLEDYRHLTEQMLATFEQNEVHITDVFFSPQHDEIGKSLTRKPGSLLMERAVFRHNVDVTKSWMIGDRERDLEAAAKVGVKGILIEANSSLEAIKSQILDD